jgi:hypothetical protein
MITPPSRSDDALLSLRRALSGTAHPQLRQASIEADSIAFLIRVRFEYDGNPEPEALDACRIAGTEVIADFSAPWRIDEQHSAVSSDGVLSPLQCVAYRRAGV